MASSRAQVGRTLFALAGSLAQGAVAPAAQALEAVLARLLPVALDLLARTFGLDKLPKLLPETAWQGLIPSYQFSGCYQCRQSGPIYSYSG